MSALSAAFLWLLPLALLPILIHLLNRLRYRTVKWAAMMFLRSADRDASRRAKIRQWIILAARCLMLAAFLLALARLQSQGRLARFFDSGSGMVVVLFDRSAGMELTRGGISGRDRALTLIQQGLGELSAGTRVVWIDSATGQASILPRGVDLSRLPQAAATSTPADYTLMLRSALQEVARVGVSSAEIWIPTDRRAASFLAPGASSPDWSDWQDLDTTLTLRLLDVGQLPGDPGNRTLQLLDEPRRQGDQLLVDLRLLRDTAEPESVPLTIDTGGLLLREDLLVEGLSFRWTQNIVLGDLDRDVHALLQIPADSNPRDNRVAISWRPRSPLSARIDVPDSRSALAVRAGLLPRPGEREVVSRQTPLSQDVQLWVRAADRALRPEEEAWIREGGILLELPGQGMAQTIGEPEVGLSVASWEENVGVLGLDADRNPLRLDLLRVLQRAELPVSPETTVLATLEDGAPFLTRMPMGDGAVYALATLPRPEWSTLDAGFVWVPMLQRLWREGQRSETRWGTHRLGDWQPAEADDWVSLDGEDLSPALDVGRFEMPGHILALNRSLHHDQSAQLDLEEIRAWAAPLPITVFEDLSAAGEDPDRRVEFTAFLALLGLIFLAIESFLLTLNIRRPQKARPAWSASA